MLKAEVPLVAEIVQRVRRLGHYDIFDPYPPPAVGVVSRLIAENVSGLKGNIVVRRPLSYTHRALVNVQEGANAMTRAMTIRISAASCTASMRNRPVVQTI
jgi:hypothetical protein